MQATQPAEGAPPEVAPDSAARRWAVRLVVAALVASALSGNSYRLGLPIAPDRVLLIAGLGLLFLSGAHRQAGRLRWRPVHALMLAMTLWTTWSALAHETLATSYGFYALLDRIIVPFALFSLAPLVVQRGEDLRVLTKAMVGLGLYLGGTAVFEMVGPQALVYPRYILDPEAGIHYGRARGPFLAAEADGMVLAACMFAAVLGAVTFTRAWRVMAVAAIPLTTIGVLLTLTRSVWVGLVLGMVALMIFEPRLRRRLVALAGTGVTALAAVLLTVPALTDLLIERLTTERSLFDRQNTNAAAVRALAEHPIDGVGWVRFVSQAADWVRQADTYPVTNVEIEIHNVVLSRAAELGLVGAALWVACVLTGPALVLRQRPVDQTFALWRPVFLGYAAVWGICIMLSPVPYVLANYLFWFLAGIALRDYLLDSSAGQETGPRAL